MDANQRKEYADQKLQDVRAGILENAGKGEEAVTNLLPPEVNAYRMMLKARLAAERGRTYTYRDPNNIPTGTIKLTMPKNEGIIARPGGWGETKQGKKEKKAAKKSYSGGFAGGGTSTGGSGLAGTSGGTRISGTGSMQPITPAGQYYADQQALSGNGNTSGGGWLGKLIATLLKDD